MADTQDIIRRALEKIKNDKAAELEAQQPLVLPAEPILAPSPIQPVIQPEPVALPQFVPAIADLRPVGEATLPTLPPSSTEQQIKTETENAANKWKAVGKTVKDILFGEPVTTSLQKQLQQEQAAVQQPMQEQVDANEASKLDNSLREPTAVNESLQLAAVPRPEQIKQKVDQIMEPVKEQAATDLAHKIADKQRGELQQQAVESAKLQQEVHDEADAKIDKVDQDVRVKSLPEIMATGTFGQKLGTALAIAFGGVSQGLTGAKTNPAIDMIDNMVEQQSKKDKLKQEEKESLRKQMYQMAELKIKQMEAQTNDEYRKEQMRQNAQMLNLKAAELGAQQKSSALAQTRSARLNFGKRLTAEDVASLSDEQNNRRVQLDRKDPATGMPMQVLATNLGAAKDFRQYAQDVGTSTATIDELIKLSDDPTAWLNFVKKGNAKMLQEALVGALRLPFKGPGSLQLQEQKDLREIAEDPTALFSVRSWSKQRLQKLKHHLNTRLQSVAKTSGINEPVTPEVMRVMGGQIVPEDVILAAARKRNPGVSDERLMEKIQELHPVFEGF